MNNSNVFFQLTRMAFVSNYSRLRDQPYFYLQSSLFNTYRNQAVRTSFKRDADLTELVYSSKDAILEGAGNDPYDKQR